MKLQILLVLSISLITVGCSNDEPAPTVSTADPVTTPPTPSENQETLPTTPPTELTPPPTDANQPPTANKIGMPDYSQHPYNPQEDIAGAVNIFSFSLANGDKEKYLSVLHGDELMINVATTTLDYLAAFKDYENAYIAAYGPDAWKAFSPKFTSIDAETLLKNLALMEIVQNGNQAVCILPGSDQPPFHTIRIDGLWYINLSLMFPYNAAQTQQFIDLHNKRITMIQDMQSLIGNPEYNPEKLDAEYAQRWNEIMKSP